MGALVERLVREAGGTQTIEAPPGIEAVRREGDGRSVLFLLNHTPSAAEIARPRLHRPEVCGGIGSVRGRPMSG
jgi:hypothetical protein